MMWPAAGTLAVCISLFAVVVSSPVLAIEPLNDQGLTAEQIVEKNVAARGGLEAWRKIQTMIWTGHIESTHASAPTLPFVMEMKRPNKTRFEIKVQNQPSVRIYDGTHGWKMRPAGSGRPEWQPYTAEELSFAKDGQGIGSPLMDYRANGIAVAFDGTDEVEGRKAYRMKITLPSGTSRHIWIDAKTFLDVKYDRETHNALGQSGTVAVYYRNYKTINGLQLPLTIESGAVATKTTDKMVIDRVVMNPPLENVVFAKPGMLGRNKVVTVDVPPPQTGRVAPPGFPALNRPGPPAPGMAPAPQAPR